MSKFTIFFIFLVFPFYASSQNEVLKSFYRQEQIKNYDIFRGKQITSDTAYDIKFYHLDIYVDIESPYIQGTVNFIAEAKEDGLSQIYLDFQSAFTIDSLSANIVSYSFQDDSLLLTFSESFNEGELINFSVSYSGIPQLAGGYKGLRYEIHDGNVPVIATLSTPYLAHYWFPCKDGPGDKADSVYIDITIDDVTYNDIPMIAVSNGILESVETNETTKTFKWRHRYPIVPYYMMIAISNYRHFQQNFNGNEGETFPIDYYVFDSDYNESIEGVAQLPEVIDFFSEIFGTYPFKNEKYGMTQLGYYGAIENQTNTIINNMKPGYFNVAVHELAHMWFADKITCENWHHGWLNEGFATYSVALWKEENEGFEAYKNYVANMEYYQGGTIFLQDDSNPFQIFVSIIYSKGGYFLHMLRGVLGDEMFFETIKTYATTEQLAYDHATTEDFQSVCEEVSGMDLDYFFEQWIYDEYYPVYAFNYTQNPETGALTLAIKQKQSEENEWREVFKMPVEIELLFSDGTDTIVNIFNDQQYQNFHFIFTKTVVDVHFDPNDWILKNASFDTMIPVSVNQVDPKKQIGIYPNPASGSFWIEFPDDIGKCRVILFSMKGDKVFEEKRFLGKMLKIPAQKEGLYFLEVIDEKGFRLTKNIFVFDLNR